MELLLWLGGGAAALLAIAPVIRWTHRVLVRVEQIADDWTGEPARPGVPPRPGVMERLEAIEQRVTAVEHQLLPNSGTSLRDAVDRVDRRTAAAADE